MIRLYKDTAEKILMALVKLCLVDRASTRDIVGGAAGYRQGSLEVQDALSRVEVGDLGDNAFEEIIQQLSKQLYEERIRDYNGDDATLIDAIVRTVQLPYVRNRIGRAQLDALRAAILTTSEISALNANLAKNELQCGVCSRTLHANEMVTIANDTYSGTNVIACHHCQHPSFVACDYCNKQANLPVYLLKASARQVDCGCTTKPKQADEVEDAPQVPDFNAPEVAVNVINPRRRAMFEAVPQPRNAVRAWGDAIGDALNNVGDI